MTIRTGDLRVGMTVTVGSYEYLGAHEVVETWTPETIDGAKCGTVTFPTWGLWCNEDTEFEVVQ